MELATIVEHDFGSHRSHKLLKNTDALYLVILIFIFVESRLSQINDLMDDLGPDNVFPHVPAKVLIQRVFIVLRLIHR